MGRDRRGRTRDASSSRTPIATLSAPPEMTPRRPAGDIPGAALHRLCIVVYGQPVPQGSMRAFVPRGGAYPVVTAQNGARLRPWRQEIAAVALREIKTRDETSAWPLLGPVSLDVVFYVQCPKSAPKTRSVYPSKKPDIDKLARGVLDAMTGIAYGDDAQVTSLRLRKRYAGRQDDSVGAGPRTEIEVEGYRDRDGRGKSSK